MTLVSIFLFLYFSFNLLDGERGLISYFEKQKKISQLLNKKEALIVGLNFIENTK